MADDIQKGGAPNTLEGVSQNQDTGPSTQDGAGFLRDIYAGKEVGLNNIEARSPEAADSLMEHALRGIMKGIQSVQKAEEITNQMSL